MPRHEGGTGIRCYLAGLSPDRGAPTNSSRSRASRNLRMAVCISGKGDVSCERSSEGDATMDRADSPPGAPCCDESQKAASSRPSLPYDLVRFWPHSWPSARRVRAALRRRAERRRFRLDTALKRTSMCLSTARLAIQAVVIERTSTQLLRATPRGRGLSTWYAPSGARRFAEERGHVDSE